MLKSSDVANESLQRDSNHPQPSERLTMKLFESFIIITQYWKLRKVSSFRGVRLDPSIFPQGFCVSKKAEREPPEGFEPPTY